MPNRDLYDLAGGKENTGEIIKDWMIAVPGIVAVNEDPEHQNRIKCIIPLMDENLICDKWIERMTLFSSPEGYGDSHVPALGSEVLLFGRQGETNGLFYAQRYNEDYLVPEELRSKDVRGFKTDKDYKQLVGRDFEIRVDGKLKITAGSIQIDVGGPIEINASRIELNAGGGVYANGKRLDI